MRNRFVQFIAFLVLVGCICQSASAVILYSKRVRNTSAPTGSLLNSGWQWEGDFGNFLGTAIGKKYFITAGHIGGQVGDKFRLGSRAFKTIASFDDPLSDMRIWQVDKAMPVHASLFSASTEVGKTAVVIGRGTARGAEVVVNGQLKGWHWKDYDFVQSWGQNVISGTIADTSDSGKNVPNAMLSWTFDRNGIANEGIISDGDSGGGVFIKDGSTWKLAGINQEVESTFTLPGTSDSFNAAIFDAGGLIAGDGTLIPDQSRDVPAETYVSRISARQAWINQVMSGQISPSALSASSFRPGSVPEPASAGLLIGIVGMMAIRRRRI